jgi:membrane protein DedA with SNARE-associated domain
MLARCRDPLRPVGGGSLKRCPPLPFPTDLASFLELIRQNGDVAYSLMFGYAAGHALLFGLFAGYAASAGAFNLTTLIIVCWLGTFTGDAVRFWIGRKFGTGWLRRFPRIYRVMQLVTQLAERHHVWMIMTHRYPNGIRGVAGFAYGMSSLPWPTFAALNFIAAGIWACVVVLSGYAFGQLSEKVMNDASSGIGLVMLIAFLGLSWLLSKRLERAIERA